MAWATWTRLDPHSLTGTSHISWKDFVKKISKYNKIVLYNYFYDNVYILIYSTGAWAAPGRVLTTVALAAPRRLIFAVQGPELHLDVSRQQELVLLLDVNFFLFEELNAHFRGL